MSPILTITVVQQMRTFYTILSKAKVNKQNLSKTKQFKMCAATVRHIPLASESLRSALCLGTDNVVKVTKQTQSRLKTLDDCCFASDLLNSATDATATFITAAKKTGLMVRSCTSACCSFHTVPHFATV